MAAVVNTIVKDDVVVAQGGSECKTRGQELGWGAVDWHGCHSSVAGCWFGAGGEVVMVIVNNIVNIDRGCTGIVGSDVAVVAGVIDDAGGVG